MYAADSTARVHDRRGPILFRLAAPGPTLASVRYRGLMPALALLELGWKVDVSASPLSEAMDPLVGVAVKPLGAPDAAWVAGLQEAGVPVIADLCDNAFVEGYGGDGQIAERLRAMLPGCTVTVPTAELRQVVIEEAKCAAQNVLLVPDILETHALLNRQLELAGRRAPLAQRLRYRSASFLSRCRSRIPGGRPVLLWFGNSGASWGRFGLADLLLFEDALAFAATRYGARLWVVSNDRTRFETLRDRLPIETRYYEWSPHVVDTLLAAADVCLVPNSLDAFSRTKSVNRAIKALGAGVPVIATRTRAFDSLCDAVWLDDPKEGVRHYLEDRSSQLRHLHVAREVIAREFSMAALADAMKRVLKHVGAA